jgi:hypothetical protein
MLIVPWLHQVNQTLRQKRLRSRRCFFCEERRREFPPQVFPVPGPDSRCGQSNADEPGTAVVAALSSAFRLSCDKPFPSEPS